jgi:predicted secreted hydrolase
MKRLLLLLLLVAGAAAAADTPLLPEYPAVTPGATMQFPRDHGAHPDFRSEWWYVTGWINGDDGKPLGFQITFFRTRPSVDQKNPSAFAVKQVLFAHAALSDPSVGHLLHDQRAARAGLGLAEASTSDADVVLDDWSLKRMQGCVPRQSRRLGVHARFEFCGDEGRTARRRERLQPQRAATRTGEPITAFRILR